MSGRRMTCGARPRTTRGDEQPDRRHHARPDGEHDARDAELARDPERVDRPRAAEADHAAAAVVHAALGGVHAEGARDVLVDDLVHAPGGTHRVDAEFRGDLVLDRGFGTFWIQRHLRRKNLLSR
jgi:hypothetical protein